MQLPVMFKVMLVDSWFLSTFLACCYMQHLHAPQCDYCSYTPLVLLLCQTSYARDIHVLKINSDRYIKIKFSTSH